MICHNMKEMTKLKLRQMTPVLRLNSPKAVTMKHYIKEQRREKSIMLKISQGKSLKKHQYKEKED